MKGIIPRAIIVLLPLVCFSLFDLSGGLTPDRSPQSDARIGSATEPTSTSATFTPTATFPPPTATPTEFPHFAAGFDDNLVLEETDAMEKSAAPDWWLNSGGWFIQRDGLGSTWLGEAPESSRWRAAYRMSNPEDTDNGAHPQNVFRLITRTAWTEPDQQIYFRIAADNLSRSPNRNASNGVLLFSRYRDGNNLYYAGLRVDGSAVIKRKSGGVYTTLAEAPWFPGAYNRTDAPNLIPGGQWIGLRTVMEAGGNILTIRLYVDPDRSGFWIPALQVEETIDSPAFAAQSGYGGIRTDFMDVEFDNYRIEEIKP
jgi:hypothetical protein